MKKLVMVLLLVLWPMQLLAGDVTLVWDPVVHPDLAGYRIYWAAAPGGPYSSAQSSGNIAESTTTYVYTGPTGSKVYFVATAFSDFGEESDHSNEVHTWVGLQKTLNLRSVPEP